MKTKKYNYLIAEIFTKYSTIKKISTMPSLLEAIVEKYGCFEDDTFDQMPIAIYVPRKNPRNMIPNLLVLNDCDIDSAGHESDLRDKCHGVEELDLAQNCLSRWSELSFFHKPKTNKRTAS